MIHYRPLNFKTDWEWVSKTISPILCVDTCGLMALRDGKLVAGCIMDSFTPVACNVHLGMEDPFILRYGFLPKLADVIFNKLDRSVIFGLTPENNTRAIKFSKHIGFVEVVRIPDAYDKGVGYVVTRMDRATSPWLKSIEEAA